MRGKGFQSCKGQFLIGITPAYAGKREVCIDQMRSMRDHPRLCGEKCQIAQCRNFHLGSPPPMRGKEENIPQDAFPHRITPAYAGKSLKLPPCFFVDQDHPRLCGEKSYRDSGFGL